MRALILGGTAFLGIALREALQRGGHEVTLFNRGITNPNAPAGVRTVTGDRTRDFGALEAERFDAVIDTSGFVPHVVERSACFFASRTQRYAFVSSISVFDITRPEIDEDSPMLELTAEQSRTEMTVENYGALKAMCERIVADTFGRRATIVRPGLIVGPHDPTDRFTYWPMRFARGGDVLAPAPPQARIQFIDVRDVAAFIVGLIERDAESDYNVTSPQGMHTMQSLLETCADVVRTPSHICWADPAKLLECGVASWMDLPLWIPESDGLPGFLNANVRKALSAALRIRPLRQTVVDTLAWAQTRPSDRRPKAGLTADREHAVLEKL